MNTRYVGSTATRILAGTDAPVIVAPRGGGRPRVQTADWKFVTIVALSD